jgi:hypothetical protein
MEILDSGYLFDSTRAVDCSDPRDRIFSVINLIQHRHRLPSMDPNYHQSYHELYRNVFSEHCMSTRSLSWLSFCSSPDATNLSGQVFAFASWVPDWSASDVRVSDVGGHFKADGFVRLHFRLHDDERLHHVDVVSSLASSGHSTPEVAL